ncbi:MAG: GtrA family protein [Pseudomonadota bacterium]
MNLNRVKDSEIAQQFSRFFLVGFLAFSTDALILQSLVSFAGWSPYWARVPSASAAVMVSWVLNRSYTFALEKGQLDWTAVFAHVLAVGIALLVNLGVYWALISKYPVLETYPVIALTGGSAAGLFVNFLLAKYWVFKSKD